MSTSVWGQIIDAVKSKVSNLTGLPTTPATRQDPRLLQSDFAASLPLLIVVDGGTGEEPFDSTFTNIVWEKYPVFVLYVKASDRSFAISDAELILRQRINDALDVRPPLSGVTATTVTDVDLAQMDLFGLDVAEGVYQVFGVKAVYTTYRIRGTS